MLSQSFLLLHGCSAPAPSFHLDSWGMSVTRAWEHPSIRHHVPLEAMLQCLCHRSPPYTRSYALMP